MKLLFIQQRRVFKAKIIDLETEIHQEHKSNFCKLIQI